MPTSPLIVLNALVIRADSQPPEGHRRARPRYNVNSAGAGIEDADARDRTLALTDRPQLEWEAFDEYWRKIHGPKILHVDGSDDRQTALLTYYLQQHRIPGGPTSERAPPYAAPLAPDGRLVTDPAARCVPYTRPAWDGIAQLGFRSRADLAAFFDVGPGKYGQKIVPDEAVFIRGFGFHVAEEHLVVAADRRQHPVVLLKTHVRNAGLTRAQFRGYWMADYAERVRRAATATGLVRRYAQLVNVSEPGDALYDAVGDRIDGVGALSFANMNDVEDFIASDAHAALCAEEQAFAAESAYFTALNYLIRDATA
ncbi:MAG: EthD domain-containing protein [Gammaproteobacteria bacterium]